MPFYRKNDDSINLWAKELDVKFIKNDSNVEKFVEFVDIYGDKRINVSFPMGIDYSAVKLAAKMNPEVYIKLGTEQMNEIEKLDKEGIKFYIDVPCTSWEMAEQIADMGSTDLYLAGDLVHAMDEVADFCKRNEMHSRVVLNRVMTAMNAKAGIYLPNEIGFYEQFIDTFEFDLVNAETGKINTGLLNVLVKNFFIKRRWIGEMSELNKDVQFTLVPDAILDEIYVSRFVCGQACLKRGYCDKCEQALHIADTLIEKNIVFLGK